VWSAKWQPNDAPQYRIVVSLIAAGASTIDAIMSKAEHTARFLQTSNDRAYCDDCLTMLMRFSGLAEAEQVTNGLGGTDGFVREPAECCLCHERKQTIRAR
jgi:hypothetical protein